MVTEAQLAAFAEAARRLIDEAQEIVTSNGLIDNRLKAIEARLDAMQKERP